MNKPILLGMAAIALGIGASGCTKKRAAVETPPITDPSNPPGTATYDSVDLVELPAMQADLVAKA